MSVETKKNIKTKSKTTKNPNSVLLVVVTSFVTILVIALVFLLHNFWKSWESHSLLREDLTLQPSGRQATKPKAVSQNEFLEVTSPTTNQVIGSPFQIAGKANFFEGHVRIKIKDQSNQVLVDTFTTAEGSMDQLYPFSKLVSFKKPSAEQGIVEIFEESAKDGSEINKITIPVIFSNFAGSSTNANSENATGWNTYTNSSLRYTLKYPAGWILDSSRAESTGDAQEMLGLTLTKGKYKIKITMPSGWGPGVCIFSDTQLTQTEGVSQIDLPGKYVEIKNPKYSLRRSATGFSGGNSIKSWTICQKEEDSQFFTNRTSLDIIEYEAPKNYSSATLYEMDKILETIDAN